MRSYGISTNLIDSFWQRIESGEQKYTRNLENLYPLDFTCGITVPWSGIARMGIFMYVQMYIVMLHCGYFCLANSTLEITITGALPTIDLIPAPESASLRKTPNSSASRKLLRFQTKIRYKPSLMKSFHSALRTQFWWHVAAPLYRMKLSVRKLRFLLLAGFRSEALRNSLLKYLMEYSWSNISDTILQKRSPPSSTLWVLVQRTISGAS